MGKFKDISDLIYNDLSSHAELTALLADGANGIYPLIADADANFSFINYYIKYDSKPSKDGIYEFTVVVNSWATNYDKALEISDEVTAAFGASTNVFIEQSGEPRFNEQDQFYIEQTFNIKK